MGLFKKSTLMTEVRLHDERISLSLGVDTLRLFLHTDAQQKTYESIALSRYNGYGQGLTNVRSANLSDIVSVSIERKRNQPYVINIVTKDRDPIWMHLVVSVNPGQAEKAIEIVNNIKKCL